MLLGLEGHASSVAVSHTMLHRAPSQQQTQSTWLNTARGATSVDTCPAIAHSFTLPPPYQVLPQTVILDLVDLAPFAPLAQLFQEPGALHCLTNPACNGTAQDHANKVHAAPSTMPASVAMAGTPCGTAQCSPVEVPHFTPHALTEEPFTPPLSQAYMSFSTSCVSSNHPPPEDFHLSFHPQTGKYSSCLLSHHLHTGAGDTSLITPQSAKPPQLSLCLSQHQSTTNESLTPHTVTTHLYVPPTSTHTLITSSLISHTPYSSSYSPWMASSAVSPHSPLMATGEHVTPPLQSLSLCKRHPQVCLASGGPLVSSPSNTTFVSHPPVRPPLVHSSPSYIPHPSLPDPASFSQIMRVPIASITSHSVTTSEDADLLHALLEPHPCATFVAQVVSGMRHGFRIGYKGPRSPLQAPNLSSAFLHPAAVDQALNKEIQAGRIAGPFDAPPFPDLRCSGLGLVPKDGDS